MTVPQLDEVVKLEESLRRLLAGRSALSFLVDLAARRGEPLYLVGGFLRDVLLGQWSDEVDLVSRRASELAAACSGERGARLVQIDRRFGALRLIPPRAERVGPIRSLDLSPLRGSSILEDLRSRDFTVNAMAVDLLAWRNNGRLEFIDPLGGLAGPSGLVAQEKVSAVASGSSACTARFTVWPAGALANDWTALVMLGARLTGGGGAAVTVALPALEPPRPSETVTVNWQVPEAGRVAPRVNVGLLMLAWSKLPAHPASVVHA